MSSPDIQIEVFGKTDVGLIREHNEDNLLLADLGGTFKEAATDAPAVLTLGTQGALFVVCDGMGGAAAGEVASQMAVDAIFEVMAGGDGQQPRPAFARLLRRSVEAANERIFQQSRDNQNERGMGTTCTAAALTDDTLVLAQIGDSRCYVLRGGLLGQVTKDQSLAWQLIEAGALSQEDAKGFEHANIILQALGVQDHVEVVMSQVVLRRGDTVLLCSDGLHGPVTDEEIQEVLLGEPDLKRAGESLLQKALERDGPDNVTVVLARFSGTGLAEPAADEPVAFVGYDPGPDPLLEKADSGNSGRPTLATTESRTLATPKIAARGGVGVSGPDSGTRAGEGREAAKSEAKSEVKSAVKTEGKTGSKTGGKTGGKTAAKAGGNTVRSPPRGRASPVGSHRWLDWREGVSIESPRSLAILFLLGLLAVAAGGIVALKCDRPNVAQESSR